jgi:transcription elongation factor GreA
MTAAALEELRKELRELEQLKRPALAARLKAAIEMGDLSENADYTAAKEEQGFVEGRILAVREMIQGAVIIETSSNPDGIVRLGSHVTVLEEEEDGPETFMIVGKVEADPRKGKISDESPLGKALLGHKKDDILVVDAPAGKLRFRIIDVA